MTHAQVTSDAKAGVLKKCFELIGKEGTSSVVTLNSLMLKYAWKHPEVLKAIKRAELITPDSVGICYASLILDRRKIYRYPGIEMAEDLIKSGKSCYFLGAEPGVAKKAAEMLKKKYPEARIKGTNHGFFTNEEEEKVLEHIRELEPDVLFVGLNMGRQEIWIDENKHKTGAGIVIGVGGSFDVFSGELKRAPELFKLTGTEWLWRLKLQPWRLGRILQLPVFAFSVFMKYIKGERLLQI